MAEFELPLYAKISIIAFLVAITELTVVSASRKFLRTYSFYLYAGIQIGLALIASLVLNRMELSLNPWFIALFSVTASTTLLQRAGIPAGDKGAFAADQVLSKLRSRIIGDCANIIKKDESKFYQNSVRKLISSSASVDQLLAEFEVLQELDGIRNQNINEKLDEVRLDSPASDQDAFRRKVILAIYNAVRAVDEPDLLKNIVQHYTIQRKKLFKWF